MLSIHSSDLIGNVIGKYGIRARHTWTRSTMPKRRRKGGVPIASKRKARPSASRVAPVFSESEEFSDDHINTDDVLEGRANFLTKLNL